MVMRYFGSKDDLFAAAADIDLRLPSLKDAGRDRLGEVLARHFPHRRARETTVVGRWAQ